MHSKEACVLGGGEGGVHTCEIWLWTVKNMGILGTHQRKGSDHVDEE